MTKGKLGFALWFYPFASLWAVLFDQFVVVTGIMLFVMAFEKDEWCIKQCMHAFTFNIGWTFLSIILDLLSEIPLIGFVISIIAFIIWLVVLFMVLFLGILPLKNGSSISLPGKGTVNKAFDYFDNNYNNNNNNGGGGFAQNFRGPQGGPQAPPQGGPQAPPQGGFTPPPRGPQGAPPQGGFTAPQAPPQAPPQGGFTAPQAPPQGGFVPPQAPPTNPQ